MNKSRRAKISLSRKIKKKRNRKQYIITLIVSMIIISSVFFIVCDSIRKSKREQFHSFYDNAYSHKYPVRGVDVSHHNEEVNWVQLKHEGITFAYLKSTEGIGHLDTKYLEHYANARDAGVKVGSYHFYTFGLDGVLQAKHFIGQSFVTSGDLIPAIDVEHSLINRYNNDKDYIQLVIDELIKLEHEIHEYYGVRPIIYTNNDCYKLYIKKDFPENLIWISDLHNEPQANDYNWIIWQFSHTGNINGANREIDLNYFRHSFRRLNQLLIP